MDYWHEIVKSYDNVEVVGSKKHIYKKYICSESTAVITLIILAFGKDHAYNIAVLLEEWASLNELPRASVLKNPSKMSVMLNKMREDNLIILDDVKLMGAAPAKIYKINPMIIQSPTNSYPYEKPYGTVLEIPQELVERFLTWLSEAVRDTSIKENFVEELKILKKLDYITFFLFI